MTFKTEVDSESLVPTSSLSSAALEWCAAIGSKAQTVEDILGGSSESGAAHPSDEIVMKAIQVTNSLMFGQEIDIRLTT